MTSPLAPLLEREGRTEGTGEIANLPEQNCVMDSRQRGNDKERNG